MMDELKRLIVERMCAVHKSADTFDEKGLQMLAEFAWGEWSGFDWVLDTIAELEIKDKTTDTCE